MSVSVKAVTTERNVVIRHVRIILSSVRNARSLIRKMKEESLTLAAQTRTSLSQALIWKKIKGGRR